MRSKATRSPEAEPQRSQKKDLRGSCPTTQLKQHLEKCEQPLYTGEGGECPKMQARCSGYSPVSHRHRETHLRYRRKAFFARAKYLVLTPVGGRTRVSDVNADEGSPHNAGSNTTLPARVQTRSRPPCPLLAE